MDVCANTCKHRIGRCLEENIDCCDNAVCNCICIIIHAHVFADISSCIFLGLRFYDRECIHRSKMVN